MKQGKYVPIQTQYKVNKRCMTAGHPFVRSCFGKYSRDCVDIFSNLSVDDFKYMRDMDNLILASLHVSPENKAEHVKRFNMAHQDEELRAETKRDNGQWIADYMDYNSYMAGLEMGLENAQLSKSLFIKSFPPLIDGNEVLINNIEDLLVKHEIVLNQQLKHFEGLERRKRFAVLGKLKGS